jgi:hypothetical protein
MDQKAQENQARQRTAVIFRVRSGEIPAQEGARLLGVSRKTYYEWEQRALEAMAEALENRPAGRPVEEKDLEKESLRAEVQELKKKLFVMEKSAEVREMLALYEQHRPDKPADTKKNSKTKKGL